MYIKFKKAISLLAALLVVFVLAKQEAHAQGAGTIRGQVTDPSAAVVPNATIEITGGGQARSEKTDASGKYTVALPPGTYTVKVEAPGFVSSSQQNVTLAAGQTSALDIALQISASVQQVDVTESGVGQVSTDPSSNAGAIVLSQTDLDGLPDDPDDLQSQLQAMAGPSAGPNGAQFFVDGFSGGQLPPKSSIREVRINSNPFAAEFDRPGFGRIEILTRPGTDSLHGSAFMTYGNRIFDTRNPYVTGDMPDYNSRMINGNLGGPFMKKFSWSLDFGQRVFNESSLVNAQALDSNLNKISVNDTFPTPQRSWNVNPRLDYAINQNNTLVLRYSHQDSTSTGGVGNYSLPTQTTTNSSKYTTVQATETMVIGTKAVNEVRFQFQDSRTNTSGAGFTGPTINVAGSFVSGGSPLLANFNRNRGYEISDVVTMTEGRHAIKFGGRFRPTELSTQSTSNFNGTYTFATPNSFSGTPACLAGITNPSSLDLYQRTLQLQAQGLSMSSIVALGCGPSQFTLNSGVPVATASQFDMGIFAQDDFRLRPNLTLSGGLRYETQTNINDHFDMAPRAAISWAPGVKGGKPGKTVFRLGWGMFFDRFSLNNTLQTMRYDGVSQQNYNISSSSGTGYLALAAFPGLPSTALLNLQNQAIYKIDSNLKSSYMMQTALSIERSLPGRTSLSVSIADSRGVHDQRTRNINAFIPGSYNPNNPLLSGVVPYPGQGDLYLYEDSGMYKQLQVITNVNTRVNSHISLNGYYAYGHYNTNVIGLPSNQYDTSVDWGRASGDVHHRAYIGGTVGLPFRWTASPSVQVSSAPPFNITTGTDLNGDRIFNDRPSFATSADDPKNVKVTQWGTFNIAPLPGETIIPVNYGTAFSRFSFDLRASRTWGWGEKMTAAAIAARGAGGQGGPGGPGGPGGGGPGGGGPGGGRGPGGPGGGGPGMGGMGGFGGFGSVGSTGKKYNLTLTISANNLLNHVNQSAPVGSLNSPFFGQVISSGGGGGFGGGGSSATGNRRIQFTLRFAF
jgi:hypothetical protein